MQFSLKFIDDNSVLDGWPSGERVPSERQRGIRSFCQHGISRCACDRRVRQASTDPQLCLHRGVLLGRGNRGVSYPLLCNGICRQGGDHNVPRDRSDRLIEQRL